MVHWLTVLGESWVDGDSSWGHLAQDRAEIWATNRAKPRPQANKLALESFDISSCLFSWAMCIMQETLHTQRLGDVSESTRLSHPVLRRYI